MSEELYGREPGDLISSLKQALERAAILRTETISIWKDDVELLIRRLTREPTPPIVIERVEIAAELATLREQNRVMREALDDGYHRLNQALGIIVEFGDLNGFRNLSDRELGAAVIQMAEAAASTLTKMKSALSLLPKETGSEG